ncbi:hypothetical protein FACS189427_11030 [Planctomycetales bacterium]|nr:hypothetical protein FACS189427_11030 [Planctomycetales bacterium]
MRNVLLNIPEKQADFVMDVLKHFTYVKSTTLSPAAVKQLNGSTAKPAISVKKDKVKKHTKECLENQIREAVKELNEVLAGRKEARDADEWLKEFCRNKKYSLFANHLR